MATTINGSLQTESGVTLLAASGSTSGTTRATLCEFDVRPGVQLFASAEIVGAKVGAAKSMGTTWNVSYKRASTGDAETSASLVGQGYATTDDSGSEVGLPEMGLVGGGSPNTVRLTVQGIVGENWRWETVVSIYETKAVV
jgi:hypothetical protein